MSDKIPSNDIIVIEDLHKYFGNVEAVKGVDLNVKPGEAVIIVGPSGSGKSTVLRCINHLEEPTAGAVYIDGVHLEAKDTDINKFNLWLLSLPPISSFTTGRSVTRISYP